MSARIGSSAVGGGGIKNRSKEDSPLYAPSHGLDYNPGQATAAHRYYSELASNIALNSLAIMTAHRLCSEVAIGKTDVQHLLEC